MDQPENFLLGILPFTLHLQEPFLDGILLKLLLRPLGGDNLGLRLVAHLSAVNGTFLRQYIIPGRGSIVVSEGLAVFIVQFLDGLGVVLVMLDDILQFDLVHGQFASCVFGRLRKCFRSLIHLLYRLRCLLALGGKLGYERHNGGDGQ